MSVTRDVEPGALRDLLDDPPRATVAFMEGDEVDVLPVRARYDAGAHFFAVCADAGPELSDREVVLVRDDGPYWFELRGISVRGVAQRAPQFDAAGQLVWYAVEPRKVLAWDYATVRPA